jgi:hypothetical protein
MSVSRDYLLHKRAAGPAAPDRAADPGSLPIVLTAHVRADGRSEAGGSRVRDFQIVTDGSADSAGYDVGLSAPALALGAMGSRLTQTWLSQAAAHAVPIDSVAVQVNGTIDRHAGAAGQPRDISYTVRVASAAKLDRIALLEAAVERACPSGSLLRAS